MVIKPCTMEKLTYFPPFDYDADKTNAGPKWEKWVGRLENLFTGLKIEDDKQQRALLLHYAGERVYDIYEAEKGTTEPKYADTKKVLTDYFKPKKNVQMEIYTFRSCKQSDTETLDEYVTKLRTLGKDCEFNDVEREILSQVIQNCRSNRLRRRALREPDKSLTEIIELGRSLELADSQASTMEGGERVNKLHPVPKDDKWTGKPESRRGIKKSSSHKAKKASSSSSTCRRCGGTYPHADVCPAQGKKCHNCNKYNHFKKMCRQPNTRRNQSRGASGGGARRHVNSIPEESEDSSEDEYTYGINVVGKQNKVPTTQIKINNATCKLLIDTGASVNILDDETYKNIGSPKLTKSNPKLMPYGGNQPLKVRGQCSVTVETKNKYTCQTFYVVPGSYGSLLGFKTAQELELVKVVNVVSDPCQKYPELFEGIGKLKSHKVKLHIDKSVKPVAICNRRTPFHLRDKVEKEIDNLLANDIIEKVDAVPTPWVSPIVTPPKKNGDEIRLCVDMREPNKAITRERHLLPTTEELIHDLNGATVFSKLDLRAGYHQLELEEDSRYITTFNTHAGMFRYKRLNFGISSASEVFQETIRNVIQGVDGVKNIADDIIVYGKNQEDHDKALSETFERLKTNGLTLNRKKCEFNKHSIEFYGLVFGSEGVSPDPKKVNAIKESKRPADVKELKSFLGMTSYCSRFIPDYATLCEPLRRLTKQDEPWYWGDKQEEAFLQLKNRLSEDSVVAYFDPKQNIEVIVDASPVGLGAILKQNKVVAYASRSLSDTESRYSQTEREALAIVWACEHFDIYLRGVKHFTVITDHKPLERIWQKRNPPLRIQRWSLRLQPYKLEIKYRPGADNPADYMSRHPVGGTVSATEETIAEQYVNFISTEAAPKAITIDKIKFAANNDATMQTAINMTRNGEWFKIKSLTSNDIDIEELKALKSIRDELTVHSDNILLKDDKIVLPRELRKQAVDIAHEGHQGMSRTKSYLRSKVWFPNLNEMVESCVKECPACQIVTQGPKTIEPLKMSDLPSSPWLNLSIDFCGPLPNGDYLLVIVDEYSRYPVVEILKSTSANTVIPVLDKVLSEFGFPRVIKSDNGSPFNSSAFNNYMQSCGIDHRRITPRWPKANAQAESFNKPMMKVIRAAHATNQSWKQQLNQFLRQYRATPHTATGYAPYSLLFSCEPRTKLPNARTNKLANDESIRAKDEHSKFMAKSYADNKNQANHREINIGETVLVKQDFKQNKLSTTFQPKPYVVSAKMGNMLTATSKDGMKITRNKSRFKKVKGEVPDITNFSDAEIIEDEVTGPRIPTKPTSEAATQPEAVTQAEPRRSTRIRREPDHLRDFVK